MLSVQKKKSQHFQTGETLIEVIVAIFVLTLISAGTTMIILGGLTAIGVNKTNLEASNLAREGVELVRNIRDTNWLKFSESQKCWNQEPDADTTDKCENQTPIQDGTYRVSLDPNNPLIILMDANPQAVLDLSTLILGAPDDGDAYYRLYRIVDAGKLPLTVHADDPDIGLQTRYFRKVDVVSEPDDDETATQMTITSTVQWLEGSHVKQIQRTEILTNYQS